MPTVTGTQLTRAEAAYAHLASFAKGEHVIVSGRAFSQPGTVTTAQQDAGSDIHRAFLTVTGCGVTTEVTVASMMGGRCFTIAAGADAAAGQWRYFDAATWAMRNPEG